MGREFPIRLSVSIWPVSWFRTYVCLVIFVLYFESFMKHVIKQKFRRVLRFRDGLRRHLLPSSKNGGKMWLEWNKSPKKEIHCLDCTFGSFLEKGGSLSYHPHEEFHFVNKIGSNHTQTFNETLLLFSFNNVVFDIKKSTKRVLVYFFIILLINTFYLLFIIYMV